MKLSDIDTPSVLIDLDVAENNIDRYQAYCDQHGLKLRPHVKTHKLPFLAHRQLSVGASGITCQKISEAEAMIESGGVGDVLITYNILGAEKLQRLKALKDRLIVTVVADNHHVVAGYANVFSDPTNPLPVLVECDTGAERCGVQTAEEAAELALAVDRAPGLTFQGLMTYPPVDREEEVGAFLARAKALIEANGLRVDTVSGGGSPGMWKAHTTPIVTEYRIGTYVYNDRSLQTRGACDWQDCALTVLATVVSVPTTQRAVVDAGSKVLTSDLFGQDGHGHVLGRPDIHIRSLSEEHGVLVANDINLAVGDRLRIVPNHACVVANMLDQVEIVRGDEWIGTERVIARGQVW